MRRLVASVVIAGVFLLAVPAVASPIGHHTSCEGTLGFDHGIVYDGTSGGYRWHHKMIRSHVVNLVYTVLRIVYRQYPGDPMVEHHRHLAQNCGP